MGEEYYGKLSQTSAEELRRLDRQYNWFALYRGCAALAGILLLIRGYLFRSCLSYAAGALVMGVFAVLVWQHGRIEVQREQQAAAGEIAEEYLSRFRGEWGELENRGSEYLTEDFPQGRDLDLFGKDSLYQYLCTASTQMGRDRFASWLKGGARDRRTLLERQNAVKELMEKQEFSTEIQTTARVIRLKKRNSAEDSIESLLKTVRGNGRSPRAFQFISKAAPWLMLVFCILALLGWTRKAGLIGLLGLGFFQLFCTLFGYQENNRLLLPVRLFYRDAAPYGKLMAAVEREEFHSEYMKALQGELRKNGGAPAALKELGQISRAISVRYNAFAFVIYNFLFSYDFRCVERFINWREKYRDDLERWLEIVGEVEALISLGVLGAVQEATCFPEIVDSGQPQLSFQNLRHPLIRREKAVGNSFALREGLCVITGSNMSGKTTFLRTVGLGLVLAYAGGPVLATEFRASLMEIHTSIHIEDSVSRGISSFYAELLRIKDVIDHSEKGVPMIALIDEIYRGTNSEDRVVCARETVKRLSKAHVMTLLTTHDFQLCDLESETETGAVNYHFSERYEGDEILFDYQIKRGRCTTSNAQHLLHLVGIH